MEYQWEMKDPFLRKPLDFEEQVGSLLSHPGKLIKGLGKQPERKHLLGLFLAPRCISATSFIVVVVCRVNFFFKKCLLDFLYIVYDKNHWYSI